jgi:hypothetical protein
MSTTKALHLRRTYLIEYVVSVSALSSAAVCVGEPLDSDEQVIGTRKAENTNVLLGE